MDKRLACIARAFFRRCVRNRDPRSTPASPPRVVALALALVFVLNACGARPAPSGPAAAELASHRAELVSYGESLAFRSLPGLDRFARLVQHAADRAVARVGPDAAERAAVRVFLDDLVDIAVGPEHRRAKSLVMVSPPLVGRDPLHESAFGFDGFRPVFQQGEGRLRHFAMSSAAGYVFPPLWVEVIGRAMGRDFVPPPQSDSAADVATNAAGRDFGLWLRDVDPSTFGDGESVARWIRDRFGEGVP